MLKDPNTGEEQRNPRHINFTDGILAEGLAKYYQATGDKAVLAAIKRHCDRRIKEGRRNANMVFAHALVWKDTGNAKYLGQALRCLGSGEPDHLSKGMACNYRNTPNITGLLATGE
jgi:rhamnogalacturonyl hydrolase YesR